MNWLDPIFLTTLIVGVTAGLFVYVKFQQQRKPLFPLIEVQKELIRILERTGKPVLLARCEEHACGKCSVLITPEVFKTRETYHIFLDFLEDEDETANFETTENGDIMVYPERK